MQEGGAPGRRTWRGRWGALGIATLALLASGTACKRPLPKPEAPAPPWAIQVLTARTPEGSSNAVQRCKADGSECTPLAAKDPVPPGSVFRIGPGGSATVSLDAAVIAQFAPNTELAVSEAPERVVSLRRGAFVLSFDGPKPEHATTPLPSVRFPGGSLSLPAARATSLSISVPGTGAALVTVHHGAASMVATSKPPMDIATGETLRILPDGTVDRRAGFRGEVALAEIASPEPENVDVPRGLGSMTARVPGTDRIVSGVRLASHHVRAFIRDGFSRTEVEEVFQNDTDQVLEGRYVFPLPPDASISRLALWVDGKLVEGEMVEAKRAAAIFKSIVDDTVRPRDPALLEWVKGSEFSLKVFPLPAHGTRTMILAYNQVLPAQGSTVRYSYPLSLGKDRSTRIEDLAIDVRVANTTLIPHDPVTPAYAPTLHAEGTGLAVSYHVQKAAPDTDFVLSYRQDAPENQAEAAAYLPELGEFKAEGAPPSPETRTNDERYVAMRFRADLPEGMEAPPHGKHDRAIVIDVSQSQSAETVAATASLVRGILSDMDPEERFVILACDSACTAFPASGLAKAEGQSFLDIVAFLQKLAPGGASDITGALLSAAQKLQDSANRQILYIGDGAPTSGELKAESMAARLRPVLAPLNVDLRLFGAGRTVDEATLPELARTLGGTYERVATGEPIAKRAQEIALALRSPVIVSPRVEATGGALVDVLPKMLPNLRVGQEVIVLGKAPGTAPVTLSLQGKVKGQPYALSRTFSLPTKASGQNPLVPRLWAEQQIRSLEASSDKTAPKAVIDLSHRFHVMSRYSSLLVLENERMFAEFGIQRTTRVASDQSDGSFVPADGSGFFGGLRPGLSGGGLMGGAGASGTPRPAPLQTESPPPPLMAPAKPAPPHRPSRPHGCVFDDVMCDSAGPGGGGGPSRWHAPVPAGPSATVVRADDGWTGQGQAELDKLTADLAKTPSSRKKLEALVRGQLSRGRVAEALPAARRFVELDPDLPVAVELLSFAAVLAGDGPLALATVDAMCETNPQSTRAHLRAARAFEAAGNEARACGHFRSLAELDPANDDYRYESLRCLARALSQPALAIAELQGMSKRSKRLEELVASLQGGTLPSHSADADPKGAIEVTVTCEGNANECPVPVVITPLGSLWSPWTPGDAKTTPRSVAFSRVTSGTYRVVLLGGRAEAHGEVDVRALTGRLKVPFSKGGFQTVANIQFSTGMIPSWVAQP